MRQRGHEHGRHFAYCHKTSAYNEGLLIHEFKPFPATLPCHMTPHKGSALNPKSQTPNCMETPGHTVTDLQPNPSRHVHQPLNPHIPRAVPPPHWDCPLLFDPLMLTGSASYIETPGHSAATTVSSPIHALRESLTGVRRVALFSLMFALPSPGLSLPFEAASLTSPDSSHGIAFLCEDSSKPGRERDDGLRSYVAVTTEKFAADLMDSGSKSAGAAAASAAGALPVQSSSYRGDKATLIWARLLEDLKLTAGRCKLQGM